MQRRATRMEKGSWVNGPSSCETGSPLVCFSVPEYPKVLGFVLYLFWQAEFLFVGAILLLFTLPKAVKF
jgi:hypothetical protein